MRVYYRLAMWSWAGVLPALLLSSAVWPAEVAGPSTEQLQTGIKYSPLRQINTGNVTRLQLAWEYHTGDTKVDKKSLTAFEDEPSLIDGNLIICSVSRKIIALDPATGKQRWVYDPVNNRSMNKCRGVASWKDPQAADGAMCKTRIFLGTTDYRLVAVDAASGKPCPDFGDHGAVQDADQQARAVPWGGDGRLATRGGQRRGRGGLDRD